MRLTIHRPVLLLIIGALCLQCSVGFAEETVKAAPRKPKIEDDASGFLFGLRAGLEKPRGDLAWQVQGAQNIAQVFLGVALKCATCHDSFIDQWTMQDAWGVAAIYSDKPLEIVRCEIPIGEHAHARQRIVTA